MFKTMNIKMRRVHEMILRSKLFQHIAHRAIPFVLAVISLASLSTNCTETDRCPWTVTSIRQPTETEERYIGTSDIAWPPVNARTVPGPDSLCLLVQNDSERHPYIYLKDLRTGETELLLSDIASSPRWSPDGKYIACIAFKSSSRPWDLSVIEIASGKIMNPPLNSSTTAIKWSPDSKTLVGAGISYDGQGSVLYCVSFPEGAVSTLDTVRIYSDYEFAWSPDSKWIAVSRPTELFPLTGDISKADLWIVSRSQDIKCKVLDTPDWVEGEPRWITDRAILLERLSWRGTEAVKEETVVVELTLDSSFHSPRSDLFILPPTFL